MSANTRNDWRSERRLAYHGFIWDYITIAFNLNSNSRWLVWFGDGLFSPIYCRIICSKRRKWTMDLWPPDRPVCGRHPRDVRTQLGLWMQCMLHVWKETCHANNLIVIVWFIRKCMLFSMGGLALCIDIIIDRKDSVKTGFWWVPQCLGEKLECPLKVHFVNSAKTNRNLKHLLFRQYLLNLEQRGLLRCQLTLFK